MNRNDFELDLKVRGSKDPYEYNVRKISVFLEENVLIELEVSIQILKPFQERENIIPKNRSDWLTWYWTDLLIFQRR